MDDLLYIAFLVAWVAFGIYKNSQKAKNKTIASKQSAPIETQPSNSRSVFEEILTGSKNVDELLDDFLKGPETSKTADYQTESTPKEPVIFTQTYTKPKYSSIPNIMNAFEEGQAQTKTIVTLFDDNEEDTGLGQDFDLRTAVLYSTILDRPYK
jgi:hypothetical protein